MPSYKLLYRKQLLGIKSENALKLEGRFAVEEGYEVVPTEKAEALVDYLLSRKMDAKLPGKEKQEEVAEASTAK